MNWQNQEKRSQGPLFAFIDLLFLLVSFLVLVLFFVQLKKTEAQEQLEQVQQKLAVSEKRKSAIEETLAKMAPVIEQFTVKSKRELGRRRAREARAIRRRSRTTVKIEYGIEKDGRIRYKEKSYTVGEFNTKVVTFLRKDNWIAFRAFAGPKIPFGVVVDFRRKLLKNRGEFDTYWDNLRSGR